MVSIVIGVHLMEVAQITVVTVRYQQLKMAVENFLRRVLIHVKAVATQIQVQVYLFYQGIKT